MKPTIGRIVIYNTTEQDRKEMENGNEYFPKCNVQMQLPAIVVAVWSEICVNIQVLADGERLFWKTSVMNGNLEGQWQWPEIVADKEGV